MFESVAYVPQLKWKAGERAAFNQLDPYWRSRILPLFRLCPPGGFEPDLAKTLHPDEFLRRFGQHLSEICGRTPILVDGELIQGVLASISGKESFYDLLTRARRAGAMPIPVYRANSEASYLKAVERYLKWEGEHAACLRVELSDLEFIASREDLLQSAVKVGAKSQASVLLIDGGPLSISDEEGIVQLLAYHFSRLIMPEDWARVVFSSTTFPKKHGLKAWQSGSFDRADWNLFRLIANHGSEFSVLPAFSDYGLEYPNNFAPKAVQPSAHLRYSTENKYFIFRGNSVAKDNRYANIFRVAQDLVNSGIFKGSEFSLGDAFIAQLSRGAGKTGHASKWRWCATDHHLTLVMKQLNALFDLGIAERAPHVEPGQLQLILP